MKKIIYLCLFVMLSSCSVEKTPDVPSNEQASALKKDFDVAVQDKNWLLALQNANVLITRFPESPEAREVKNSFDDVNSKAQAMQDERRLANLWDYQQVTVGSKLQYSAGIFSKVEMFAGEPSDLPPAARLIVRIHPEWGNSIYLVFSQSKFQCGSPCKMKISFDDGQYQSFPGKQADTGTGPALFIENDKIFYKAMLSAKNIKIKINGVPNLEYEVGSYDAKRLGSEFIGK